MPALCRHQPAAHGALLGARTTRPELSGRSCGGVGVAYSWWQWPSVPGQACCVSTRQRQRVPAPSHSDSSQRDLRAMASGVWLCERGLGHSLVTPPQCCPGDPAWGLGREGCSLPFLGSPVAGRRGGWSLKQTPCPARQAAATEALSPSPSQKPQQGGGPGGPGWGASLQPEPRRQPAPQQGLPQHSRRGPSLLWAHRSPSFGARLSVLGEEQAAGG